MRDDTRSTSNRKLSNNLPTPSMGYDALQPYEGIVADVRQPTNSVYHGSLLRI